MSRYPDGTPSLRCCSSEFVCNDCGYAWDVPGTVDLGQWEADREEDMNCPRCGSKDTE